MEQRQNGADRLGRSKRQIECRIDGGEFERRHRRRVRDLVNADHADGFQLVGRRGAEPGARLVAADEDGDHLAAEPRAPFVEGERHGRSVARQVAVRESAMM